MSSNLSVFKNAPTVEPGGNTTVENIVKRIRSEKYRPQTSYLRTLIDAEAARTYKAQNFVGVTWSGTFAPTRKAGSLQAHSGLICIDLDKLPADRLTTLKTQLQADEYTHVLFVSPSGNGLKVVVKIGLTDPAEHRAYFQQIADYYRDCYAVTDAELDASGKNVDRLCFLPCDPDAFHNPDSAVMPLAEDYQPGNAVDTPAPRTERYAAKEPVEDSTRQLLRDTVSQLTTRAIDLTDTYERWVEIGFALASLGDEGRIYFHEVSRLNASYDYRQCDSKFTELLRSRNGSVSIGTFFSRCQEVMGKTWEQSPPLPRPRRNGFTGVSTESAPWPQPQTPTTTLLPVLPMTPNMLPESLRPWLIDIASRMKCPPDFVASAVVVMLSALVGTRLTIKPKTRDDWTIVPNLWGAVIGDPSTMKTPSIMESFAPLRRLMVKAVEEQKQRQQRYEAEQVRYEAQKKVYLSQEQERMKGKVVSSPVGYPEAPDKPTERRYMVNDVTVEKLAELLNENPTGLLVWRDELIGLLAGWDRTGREQDRAFYLEAWNGNGSQSVDRIGRGTIHVPQLCVSLFGGIQPAKLLGYLQAATGYDNDGFVQRLQLAVYPDKTLWEYGDDYADKAARDRAFAVIQHIATTDFACIGYPADGYNRYSYTRFDEDAQAVFKQWLIEWETNVLPAESGLLLEHFTKYRSLMPSLALLFHVVACADAPQPVAADGKYLVSGDAARMAVQWCTYLQSHARRIYGLLDTVSITAAKELLKHLKAGDLKAGFKARDVRQKGWANLTTSNAVESALCELVNLHWLREVLPDTPAAGRPEAAHYLIHPQLSVNT